MKNTKLFSGLIAATLLTQTLMPGATALAQEVAAATAVTAELKVMHTSDIHGNLMDYDYYTNQTGTYGLTRVATLIEAERAQALNPAHADVDNSLLFENGDLIQGNPLGDYYATVNPVQPGETHPIYQALNTLGFDAATAGNHEFNFGLNFLKQIVGEFNAPYLNANVKMTGTNEPLFGADTEYKIIEEKVVTSEGVVETVKVGVTGVVAPAILRWDEAHLKGKVEVEDMVQATTRVTAEMKAQGADIVVVMAHTGAGSGTGEANVENAGLDLLKVPGLDLVMGGHSHFSTTNQDEDTFLVQPAEWGKELGVMDFGLVKQADGSWDVDMSASTARVAKVAKETPNHPATVAAVQAAHEATLAYVATPVATSEIAIDSFLSQVSDNVSLELVQQAQTWYVENQIASGNADLAPYAQLPILSAAAPFKAGGRDYNDITYYVDVAAGELTMGDFSNLYIYPNTLTVVKVTGEDVKNWLEVSAGQFNQITPGTHNQDLLNKSFRSYNYDVINGVTYQIDVTQPARYVGGNLVNADANRIVNLEFNGEPIDLAQEFLVITNNYRAGGGDFKPAVNGEKIVFADSTENRQVITQYAQHLGTVTAENLQVDHNWSFVDIPHTSATFNTAAKAEGQLADVGNSHITKRAAVNADFAQYAVNFNADVNTDYIDLQLLTFNDFHGQFDKDSKNGRSGVEYLTAYLKRYEETHNGETLVLSAGDLIGGSQPVTSLEKDEPTIEIFNDLIDVAVVGNHEFDRGTEEFLRIMNGGSRVNNAGETVDFAGANFPYLAANVVDKTSKKPISEPYTTVEVDGVKIGIIGVVTVDTARKVMPSGIKTIDFLDETETINKYAEELSKDGVKSIFVLSHVPTTSSKEGVLEDLAETSDIYDIVNSGKLHPEVDMIIGADNHAYANALIERENGDDVLVTQAYSKGSAFGDTHVMIDRTTGDVVSQKATIVNTTHANVTPDQATQEKVAFYYAKVDDQLNKIVGNAPETIKRTIYGFHGESELGRLIAEAQLFAVQSIEGYEDAEISLMNIGGVRADIESGDVTWNQLFTVQPFANDLTIQEITGDQLKRTLELQEIHDWVIKAQAGEYARPRMLQIAGFNYTWHPEQNADGKWVVKVDAMSYENAQGQQVTIEADTKIKSVANIFVATGGDGFTPLAESDYQVVVNDLEAFEMYIAAQPTEEVARVAAVPVVRAIDVTTNPNVTNLDANFDGVIDNPTPEQGFGPAGTVTPEVTPEVDAPAVPGEGPAGTVTPEVEQTTTGGTTTTKPDGTLPNTGMSQAEVMLVVGAVALTTGATIFVIKRKKVA